MNQNVLKTVFTIFSICMTLMIGKSMSQPIHVEKNDDGILVKEGDKKVFFYQQKNKSLDGKYTRANYIHPLYSLDEEVLTEDFPEDHLHQRGIYWAWHQIYIGDKNLGDAWTIRDFVWDVKDVSSINYEDYVLLKSNVLWKSSRWRSADEEMIPFVSESVFIKVFRSKNQYRLIDFKICLSALIDEVKIGGSDDVKGYGGFSIRLILPEDIKFYSEKHQVIPEMTSIKAGAWMDFTGSFQKGSDEISGVAIFCSPKNPGYPERWILRDKESMQNAVYPGRNLITLPKGEELVLQYRLMVHKGDINPMDMDEIYQSYIKTN